MPNWPKAKDPRFFDETNPLYKPDANAKDEYLEGVNRQEFETFYRYVQLNWTNGKKSKSGLGGGQKKGEEEKEKGGDGSADGIDEGKDERISPPKGEEKVAFYIVELLFDWNDSYKALNKSLAPLLMQNIVQEVQDFVLIKTKHLIRHWILPSGLALSLLKLPFLLTESFIYMYIYMLDD